MIQANELRIGNWVVLGKETRQVEGWMFIQEVKNMGPIEITPEVLEKCGFNSGMSKGISRLKHDIDDPDEEGDTYYWDLKVPKNDQVEDLHTFNLVQFGKGNDIKFAHQWLRVTVKYLHQLQNLYFALTGIELEIPSL